MQKRGREMIVFCCVIVFALALIILINGRFFTGFAIYQSQPGVSDGKDTYLRENLSSNFGTDTRISVGKVAAGNELHSIIEFNLSAVPSSNTIVSATLSLYMFFSNTANNVTVSIYRVTQAWNETESDWYNATGSASWSNVGGDYDPTIITTLNVTSTVGWYNFTISSVVREWVNETSPNYGIILIPVGASAGDFKYFYSSDYTTDTSLNPIITIDYSPNAPPVIVNMTVNSTSTAPSKVGSLINFSINWTDIDSTSERIFFCNSSSITINGCTDTEFCNTSYSTSNPQTCIYTAIQSNNRTTQFWGAVCDSANCSQANQSQFYVNHVPNVTITQPNGGETINQSQGNYRVRFNVSDSDGDILFSNLYYGESANATTSLIVSNLNLTTYCTDSDQTTRTRNNCSYMWNTTGIYGSYFLTAILNDTFELSNDTSDAGFSVVSLYDSVLPVINNTWLSDTRIYSGKLILAYANITEENPRVSWITINTTPSQTINFTKNANNYTYNASFIASSAGNYQYIVYSRDMNGNTNQTTPVIFTVTSPNASAQNMIAPNKAQPYSTVRISSQLNASDPLRDVYAYLNIPNGFIFLQDYPQNSPTGNFSANETKTANWFVASPITEGNYTLNVTFTDYYSDTWNSSNTYLNISYSATSGGSGAGYSLHVAGYPEVQTASNYFVNSMFSTNGVYTNADSMLISIYDAVGSLIVGPASMTSESTGNYNYSYSVGSSVNEGQWETIINATKDGISYYANQFWKVIGGPFDVRNISIDDSTVSDLSISVTAENTGGVIKDLTLTWNLTREDTGQLLDSGADTFAVNANSERIWTVTPTTAYVGQVRITFIGFYSGTEKAGAYKIFSTTSVGSTPSGSGGGGGGGGGSSDTITTTPSANTSGLVKIVSEDPIYISKNIIKNVSVKITNNKQDAIKNAVLVIDGIPQQYYKVFPSSIDSIDSDDSAEFTVQFFVIDLSGEQPFEYVLIADNETYRKSGTLMVISANEFLEKELDKLREKINKVKELITTDSQRTQLQTCEAIISSVEENIRKEKYLDAKDRLQALEDCINQAEKDTIISLKSIKTEQIIKILPWVIGIIVLILIIIGLYFLYRKVSLLRFMMKEGGGTGRETMPETKKENIEVNTFDAKLSDIRKKLGQDSQGAG